MGASNVMKQLHSKHRHLCSVFIRHSMFTSGFSSNQHTITTLLKPGLYFCAALLPLKTLRRLDVHLQTTHRVDAENKSCDWTASLAYHIGIEGCPVSHPAAKGCSVYTPPPCMHYLTILDQHLQ